MKRTAPVEKKRLRVPDAGGLTDRRNQAVFLMRACKNWGKAAADQKREIASSYLAPFLFDEDELKSVIAEADKSV